MKQLRAIPQAPDPIVPTPTKNDVRIDLFLATAPALRPTPREVDFAWPSSDQLKF
jgi:hypothetical protein